MITVDELATIPLFSTLGKNELEYVASSVEDIRLIPGEYVAHEGEGPALFVVVEGGTELTKVVNGVEVALDVRLPGGFFGGNPVMMGMPLAANMRASEPSRVIKLSVKLFYTLMAMAPQVAEAIGSTESEYMLFLRKVVARPADSAMLVIGPRLDPDVHAVQTFLHRNQIPFDTVTPEDYALGAGPGERGEASGPFPVLQLRDGTQLSAPTMRDVARAGGLQVALSEAQYDVVIVGGGPAGLTAAVNGAAEGLRTVLIERFAPGGQAGTSTRIENYTGFPFGISGDDLASRALQQAKRLGAEIVVTRQVNRIDPDDLTVTLDGGDVLRTRSIVLATGVEWRHLGIGSIDHLVGRGVYYGAARSDAGLAHGNGVYLIGAGNSAGQASLFFSNHARTVTLIVRGESLGASMSEYLVEQIATKPNIRVETRSEVVGVRGDEQLEAIEVIDRRTGTTSVRDTPALFIMIGADAATGWLPEAIARDSHGYVLTGEEAMKAGRWKSDRDPYPLETSAAGVFTVGDVRSGSIKRVAAAVGEGGIAIAFVHRHMQVSA